MPTLARDTILKKGLVVSDLHCGSLYGMLPEGFVNYQGVEVNQHVGQKYLWECWMDFCERAKTRKPDFVIVNGDILDGLQKKNKGAELSLIAPADQSRAAVDTLQVLKLAVGPKAKWYFTQGTPYHVGVWGDREEEVAAELGAEKYSSVGTGKLCREILWLKVDGVIIEAAHHISVSSGFYRLTGIDREMQWSAMTGKDESKGVPRADLLIRSHVHFFGKAEHASKIGFTTPCWQLQTRYMRKNSTSRMLPDIGGVFLEVDGEAKKRGEVPVRIERELYKLPAVKLVEL